MVLTESRENKLFELGFVEEKWAYDAEKRDHEDECVELRGREEEDACFVFSTREEFEGDG